MSKLIITEWSASDFGDAMDATVLQTDRKRWAPAGVSIDSRTIEPGELFFAIKGERFDGHHFVSDAVEKGAAGVVVSRDDIDGVERAPIVFDVADSLEALQALGHAVWREAKLDGALTINITGSNGKTTVKEFTSALWSLRGNVYATEGNLNNHIGLPLVLSRIPRGTDVIVLELGANDFGEIAELIRMAPGQIRVITSIARDHLEGFGDIEGVRRAKSEIFDEAPDASKAILPVDEKEHLLSPEEMTKFDIFTVGSDEAATIRLVDFSQTEDVAEATLKASGSRIDIGIPFPGRHQAQNLATALATFSSVQEPLPTQAEIEGRLADLELPGGRWREQTVGEVHFVDDAYNANPDSLQASAEAFVSYSVERSGDTVLVMGEMAELGDQAERLHIEAASRLARFAVQIDGFAVISGRWGEKMTSAFKAKASSNVETEALASKERLVGWLKAFESPTVLLKGSRAAALEKTIEKYRGAL
jgi:UDP-N-acetylmuramoyl-tripeptide--D-alanyl-D-alanine ligase